MKTMLLLLASFIFILHVQAQNEVTYNPFRIFVSVGANIHPRSLQYKGNTGLLFAIEPTYSLQDYLDVGLRLEFLLNQKREGYSPTFKGTGSYLITLDYYPTKEHALHPFFGAGAGFYKVYSDPLKFYQGVVFGGMIRAGLELHRFRVTVESNYTKRFLNDFYQNNNYLGLKLGVAIGGGITHK